MIEPRARLVGRSTAANWRAAPRGVILASLILRACCAHAGHPTERVLTSAAQLKGLRADATAQAEARRLRTQLARYLKMSYDQLWATIPPAQQLRAVNVAFQRGCPICGTEIYRKGGHYPWLCSADRPFKVQCPACQTTFPSNDFRPWTTARGQLKPAAPQPYFDDGFGYVDQHGAPFYFVAYYVFWQLWRGEIPQTISGFARLYLISGDIEAGRRAVILLAKLASQYPQMEYQTQSVHIGKWPSGYAGKILDYVWENTSAITYTTAYDHVRDALQEPQVKAFLATKGIDDPHAYVYKNLLQGIVQAYLDKNIHGNMGWQHSFMHVVRVIDNDDPMRGHTTREMLDWLLYGGGEMAVLLYNGVTRDGAGCEGSVGYNGSWWDNLYRLAGPMKQLGFDLWAVPPWAPRLKKMSDYYLDLIVAEKYLPSIGDGGCLLEPQAEIRAPDNFRLALSATGDRRFLRQLRRLGQDIEPLLASCDEPTRAAVQAEPEPLLWSPRTRNLGGFGLAVLESGRGDQARGVAMYYGSQGAWHGHKDRLNIEYIARATSYLPEMGYPAHWGDKAYQWTMGTASHYTVLVDQRGHQGKPPGALHLLADGTWARVMEASAERVYPERATTYRRTVAMLDVGQADSYLIDIFRVAGGRQHDYSFHGLPWAEVTSTGLRLSPARPGTVAGVDVPFGQRPQSNYHQSGYYYLDRPRSARPAGPWQVTWRVQRDPNRPRGLRLHVPAGVCQEVILAEAEPELSPGNPRRMEWLLLRNRAVGEQAASSVFLGIMEPYVEEPLVHRVETLQPRDAETARRAGWVGLRIEHRAGVDVVCSALDDTVPIETTDGLRFQGRFGAVRHTADGAVRQYLVNGHVLAIQQNMLRSEGPVHSQIARVLYRQNAIELNSALASPEQYVDRVAIVQRGDHHTSYTVRSATNHDGRTRLGFGDVTCIVGIVAVDPPGPPAENQAGSAPLQPNQFSTKIRLRGYGIKFTAAPIVGLSAVSEDFTVAAPIIAQQEATFTLGNHVTVATLTDADGDGRRMAYLADLSVGEHVILPTIVERP